MFALLNIDSRLYLVVMERDKTVIIVFNDPDTHAASVHTFRDLKHFKLLRLSSLFFIYIPFNIFTQRR